MIMVRLIGGLGNQMFQYATGRSVALRYGVPLLLDASGFANYDLRHYELDAMDIAGCLATRSQLLDVGIGLTQPTLIASIKKHFGLSRSFNKLKEASFTYDSRIEKATSDVYLDGYWQSERYFAAISDLLRKEFSLRELANEGNVAMAGQIVALGKNAVSLHVRRGDYVNNARTAQYHGVCSTEYYRQAANYIGARVEAPHFFVFSDDHAWVRESLNLPYPMTLVDVNTADRGVWDMALMKLCRHHIIANSSFSWWGAWLNPHLDKIVVCPQRWFSAATHDTSDLIPQSWIRL